MTFEKHEFKHNRGNLLTYLISNLSLGGLCGISLVLVDEGLHHPLLPERGEP